MQNNSFAMITFTKKVGGPLWGAQKSTSLAANVYPQDELRGVRKDELLRVKQSRAAKRFEI